MIEPQENKMVKNVFRLDARQISSVMVPRSEVVYLNTRLSYEENIARIQHTDFSKYPVTDGGLHNIVGVITAQQLLKIPTSIVMASVCSTVCLSRCFYPKPSMAWTCWHSSKPLILSWRLWWMSTVTCRDRDAKDIIEAITGEFKSPDEEAWIVQRSDGSWLVDGLIPTAELKELLGLEVLPEDRSYRYHTLAGLVMLLLGNVPRTGISVSGRIMSLKWWTWMVLRSTKY
ncbi:hypothetical protein PCI56_01425 [Plesiomonas shigelloides subsp. oncorhynchi]|nr:hypothetical protein [Plesiomonas shigelloides]